MNCAIIAVGYNRLGSLERLLKSICNAKYSQVVDLIISLDKSDNQADLVKMAESVNWKYGEKTIRAFKTRQGLRSHILQCGDLTKQYDAVIVLEDDLVVSSEFFDYVLEAIEFYKDDNCIAGISLYSHKTNPGNGRYFEPAYNGYDSFMMQYAQSWGQCWTRKMWEGFRKWYDLNEDYDFRNSKIPSYVSNWNAQSWLKYYIAYCVDKGFFYVYPYYSHTTNSTAVGEHNKNSNSSYQVPLLLDGMKRKYCFAPVSDSIKYDVFFERIFSEEPFLIEGKRAIIDLYGLKNDYSGYELVVSTKALPFKIIGEIGLQYRPHEQNLINAEPGKGIYLYDPKVGAKSPKSDTYNLATYDLKAVSAKETLSHAMHNIIAKLLHR